MKRTTITQVFEKKAFTALLAAALPLCASTLNAQVLQGQSKTSPGVWTTSNLDGWAELDYIPMRVSYPANSAGYRSITLIFPHFNGKIFGFENLSAFTLAGNAVWASAPKLGTRPDGNWTYTVTIKIADNNPVQINFLARLAAGSHMYGGSSLQIKSGAGNLAIHKSLPGPALPDLALSLTGPATAVEGGALTYTLTYTNKAALDTGFNVQINEMLSPEIVIDPASLPANASLVGNTLFFDLGNLAPQTGGQISFVATVSPTATIGAALTNFSQIVSAENDANPADNEALASTTVLCGGISTSIVAQPASATLCSGQSVVLAVNATGPAGLAYQWYKDGNAVAGATSNVLVLSTVVAAQGGTYTATVTSPCDTITSAPAALALTAEPPLSILGVTRQSDGSMALNFFTGLCGSVVVEYTTDFVTWTPSPVTVPAQAGVAQWIDGGMPATDSMPNGQSYRFYRLSKTQ